MLIVLLTTCLLTVLSVGVHYTALSILTEFMLKRDYHVRRWVGVSVLGMLLAHVIEVTMYAIGYVILGRYFDYGDLIDSVGEEIEIISDYWYFSFVSYTSLGFGDIVPIRALRLMTALETLTGLILIAWSASFIFMQMHRFWSAEDKP